jgi:thiamine biosynthesis protein ThiC
MQIQSAKQGTITPEMEQVAAQEEVTAEYIR